MTFRICFWVGKKSKVQNSPYMCYFLKKGNVNIFAFIFLNGRTDNKKLLLEEKGRGHKWDFTNIFCFVTIILELWKCLYVVYTHTHTHTWNHENIWSHSWAPVRLTGGWQYASRTHQEATHSGATETQWEVSAPVKLLSLIGHDHRQAVESTVEAGRDAPSSSSVSLMSSNDKA